MVKLKKYTLGELIDVRRGASLAGEYYATEGELMRLTLGHFDYQNGGVKKNTSKTDLFFVGPVKPEFVLSEGDIITPLTEQTPGLLGSTAMIPESDKYIQSQDVALITPDESKLDRDFCYYLLPSKIVKQQLAAGAQQTKIRHTTPDRIKDLTVFIPSLPEQQAIGKLLKCIDGKIALNRDINRNLEAMARQLYNYWFVQFDFPDENGRPYKSSGGKMVWNEKLKRDIPEGWDIKKLCEIEPNIITGKTPSTSHPEYFGGDIPFVTIDDIRTSRVVRCSTRTLTATGAKTQRKKFIPFGSLMCSCIGTVGVMGFCGCDLQTNQQINSIVFRDPDNSQYIFFALEKYFASADAKVGNILPNMSKQEFGDIPIIYPQLQLLKEYAKLVNNYFDSISINCKELESLIRQRDELLPLLMNGQVSVMPSEVNCDLSE